MKKIILGFLVLFGFQMFSCQSPNNGDGSGTHSAANKILPYPINQYSLPNGLNVVTVPFDSPKLASFQILVRVGSRNEVEEGVTGFAHFFEHMMFRGTEKYPKEKYQSVLKSIGASANAYTSNDKTVYFMTGDATKLESMFEIESDRFQNLDYSVQGFKTEAGAVKGEYTKNNSSFFTQLQEKIQDKGFDTHPYKHTTMGFFKDIVDMPNQFEYSREFFNRYYRPEYCTIIVVGDVTPEKVNSLAKKYFGDWKKGEHISTVPVEPEQKGERMCHVKFPGVPPFMSLNFKGPAFSDSLIDMPTLDIISTIFFSDRSDIFKKLVREEQKARFISGGAGDSRDPYFVAFSSQLFKEEDFAYVKEELMATFEKIKTEKVSDKLLADTKSHLKYGFAMGIDNPQSIARNLAHYTALTGNPETINNLYEMYEKVTAEDIMAVAKKYFVVDHLTTGTVSGQDNGPFEK